jgi:hypothetical protein
MSTKLGEVVSLKKVLKLEGDVKVLKVERDGFRNCECIIDTKF